MYRWWPAYAPIAPQVGSKAAFAASLVAIAPLVTVLCLPPVAGVTGLAAYEVLGLFGGFLAWHAVASFALVPLSRRSRWAFHVSTAGNAVIITTVTCAFPVLSGDPRSVFWVAPVMYACFNGAARELQPSIGVLAINAGFPAATIPLFLAQGAPVGWSVAAPLICAATCFCAYHYLAGVSAAWREIARERDAALEQARRAEQELERRQLAQDLHDSVGSALSLVALYGDLVDRLADDPAELRKVAAVLREAASEGLVDLRGVLEAMAPRASDAAALTQTLATIGSRVSAISGAEVTVELAGDAREVEVPGPVRLAVVRTFQETVSNAVRHGRARHIEARLRIEGGRLELEVADDGAGPGGARAGTPPGGSGGRGLAGLGARAEALGGRFELCRGTAGGARARLSLPVR